MKIIYLIVALIFLGSAFSIPLSSSNVVWHDSDSDESEEDLGALLSELQQLSSTLDKNNNNGDDLFKTTIEHGNNWVAQQSNRFWQLANDLFKTLSSLNIQSPLSVTNSKSK